MVDEDQKYYINRFSDECADFLTSKHKEYQDPIMMGGVMMKATLQMYLSCLSDEDMETLLQVVSESIPQVRKQIDNQQFSQTEKRILH
tara:strand:+ start:3804 stop:4067 length:264 start_codon:yes stop_codon:yes gene_type:complete